MNIKDEAKIVAMVEGTGRYKLWDTKRNDTYLCFPDLTCFALWHYYWTHESDEQEFWQGQDAMLKGTGLSRNTLRKHRKWLLKHGWLVDTGKVAADMYEDATRGSHQVKVLRANDPRPKGSEFDPSRAHDTRMGSKFDPVPRLRSDFDPSDVMGSKFGVPKNDPNVYSSCFGSSCSSKSSSSCYCSSDYQCSAVVNQSPPVRPASQGEEPKPKPETTPKPTPVPSKLKTAKNGTPYPEAFDSWPNAKRLTWLEQNKLVNADLDTFLSNEPTPPVSPTPPPSDARPPSQRLRAKSGEWYPVSFDSWTVAARMDWLKQNETDLGRAALMMLADPDLCDNCMATPCVCKE